MRVVEGIFEHRVRRQIRIDGMQFGFMKGRGTTDAILWQDGCGRILELKVEGSVLVLWIWRKLLMGCRERW